MGIARGTRWRWKDHWVRGWVLWLSGPRGGAAQQKKKISRTGSRHPIGLTENVPPIVSGRAEKRDEDVFRTRLFRNKGTTHSVAFKECIRRWVACNCQTVLLTLSSFQQLLASCWSCWKSAGADSPVERASTQSNFRLCGDCAIQLCIKHRTACYSQ